MENLRINEKIQKNLLSSANWLQFISVISAIGIALMVLTAICMLFISLTGAMGVQSGVFLLCGILYLVLCGLYIYPLIKSFSLVDNIRKSMKSFTQDALDKATDDFKTILKFTGIMIIVAIVIYVIIIIGALALAAAGIFSNI